MNTSVRRLRFDHDEMTQEELAKKAGVSRQTIIANNHCHGVRQVHPALMARLNSTCYLAMLYSNYQGNFRGTSALNMNLHHILIVQHVIPFDNRAIVDGTAPDFAEP